MASFRDPKKAHHEVNIYDWAGDETRVMAVWRKLKEEFRKTI